MTQPPAAHAIERALAHHRAGRLAEAEAIYRQLLAAEPRNADALHLLGLIAQQVARHDDAIMLLNRAAALNPQRAETFAALGASLGVTGRVAEAATALSRAVQLKPDLADAHLNLGNAYKAAGQLERAIESYGRALLSNPEPHVLLAAHRSRGRALLVLARAQQAIDDLAAVALLAPAEADNHFQLGLALERCSRRDDAADSYRRTIELNPTFAEAHFNLGACLSAGSEASDVIGHFTEAIRLRPDLGVAQEKVLHLHHYATHFDHRESFERHRAWAARFADPLTVAAPPHANDRDPQRRLRIGYVSRDFRRHSVSYFLEPLLAAHDKRNVEVFCYADEIKCDATTERMQRHADCWRTMTGASDEDLAQRIRADHIDILIDLAGHTENNRLLTFARKPAPVQVSFLGYPDTTGMAAMDFRLTDALADPPGASDAFYTEQLIHLPDCAWCYRPDDQSPPLESNDAGGAITFGCFNVATKINAALIETWAAILRVTPGSRMIIKDGQGTPSPAIPRLRREFDRHGIGDDRVEFLSYVPDVTAHLALYRRVDVALDTYPYNGTTTTCEAMWMGVPVVTMVGPQHLSRVGSSLLSAVGRSDLIAQSRDEYVALPSSTGRPTAQQRRDLREQMRCSPLMNADRFARNVEAAYREMWARYARG